MNLDSILPGFPARALPAMGGAAAGHPAGLAAVRSSHAADQARPEVQDSATLSDTSRELLERLAAPRLMPRSVQALSPGGYDLRLASEAGSKRVETSFSLQVTTREGDVVQLDFRQAEFAGVASSEGHFSLEAGFERAVSLSVSGDLSAEERAALDGLIARVAGEAGGLFEGDLGATAERLAGIGFDGETLASFALEFRHARYEETLRTYAPRADQGLGELVRQDAGVAALLGAMADAHRQLVEGARELFAAPDAARLGRAVIPSVFGSTAVRDASAG